MNRDGDEFDRPEIEDHLLDLAADHQLRADDWDDLHEVTWTQPSLDDALAEQGSIRRAASADAGHDLWWSRRG